MPTPSPPYWLRRADLSPPTTDSKMAACRLAFPMSEGKAGERKGSLKKVWFSFLSFINRVAPKNLNSRYSRFFRTCSDQQLFFFTLLDRASFPHYNNTKIIKFGWELFISWVISYGRSFSGFARFPEFWGTINDSFSSTCANTYQDSTSYKEISVPMTCLDCKSLLGNTKELQTKAPWQYTDHWTQYSLNLWTAEAVINRASELEFEQIPKMTVHKILLIK